MIAVVAAVLVVVLIVAGSIWWANRDTPEKAVERFFKELRYVSVADMPSVVDISPAEGAWANEIHPDRTPDNIISMRTHGNTVSVTYSLAGTSHTTDVQTIYIDGKYKLSRPSTLTIASTTTEQVLLNTSSQPVPTNRTVKLWPGTYKVRTSTTPWIEYTGGEEFILEPGQSKSLTVAARLSDRGRDEVAQAVASRLRDCVGPSADESHCPSALPKAPSDAYWYPVSYAALRDVQVAPDQPLANVCGTGTLSLQLNFRRTVGTGQVATVPFKGCFDVRQSITSDAVKWV